MFALMCTSSPMIEAHSDVAYGQKNVEAYVKYSATNHGSDGALFLDAYFKPAIENLAGKTVLDIGCGAATWCIYAAHQGGAVYGVDIQPEMIQAATQKVVDAGFQHKISVAVGDASALDFKSDFFDREISICVGCNLPSDIFEKSFKEMARTLKQNGKAVVGTPYSLDIVFTNGSKSQAEVQEHIKEVLAALPDDPTHDQICEKLSELTEVLSATFYIKDGRLKLVTDEKELTEGEKIWRKLPKPIVPNRYHSKDAYFEAIKEAKLKVTQLETPRFIDEQARLVYNRTVSSHEQLGQEYVSHAPFAIYHLERDE